MRTKPSSRRRASSSRHRARGASVSVIHARDIQKRGSLGFNDVLRGVPGLDVYSNGGPGAQTSVALRGSTPGQTLVLIDGIRIGDPTSTDGSVDFGRLLPTDIERIEVLRGPQSALYGSDAMGGVINIITRRGKGAPQGWLMSEGGSYGTSSSRASISGADGQGSYALSISGLHADGFPRYGYRPQRPIFIGDQTTPLPPLPANDPTNTVGVTGRIGYDFTEDARIEAGIAGYDSAIRYDNPYAFNSWSVFDPFNHQHATFMQGYVRLGADMFDKALRNRLTLYANRGNRDAWIDGSLFRHADLPVAELPLRLSRRAAGASNIRAISRWGRWVSRPSARASKPRRRRIRARPGSSMITRRRTPSRRHGPAMRSINSRSFDRLDISYGGRADAVSKNQTFLTWRTMANFRIDEIGMRLRGSAATGAKTASLYQRFSRVWRSDARARTRARLRRRHRSELFRRSRHGFRLRLRQSLRESRAVRQGRELHVDADLRLLFQRRARGYARRRIFRRSESRSWRSAVRGSYTFLAARNLDDDEDSIYAGRTLLRRPRHKGMWSVIYTGAPGLELEARANIVGAAHDVDFIFNKRVMLAPYVRLDLFAELQADRPADAAWAHRECGQCALRGSLQLFYDGARLLWRREIRLVTK